MSDKVLVSIENGIAVVTINRPEVRNAVDKETWGLLRKTFENLDSNRDVRAIIVTGAGEKAFVAGADLNSLKVRSVLETLDSENNAVVRAIEKVSKPTIAAINGYCLGGGCEIALACDIRIAAEKAKIELSGVMSTNINLPFITADATGPKHLDITLTRAKFDELTHDLVEKTMGPVKQALKDAGLQPSQVDKVLLARHERRRNKTHTVFYAEKKVGFVLLAKVNLAERFPREGHTFAV